MQALVAARDAELKALKAQINPHFLFNSLNSISALAGIDAARAREMCVRLSDFLRSSLSVGEREAVPLSEELALAHNYLGVEQVRFGGRLRVEQQIAPECESALVPPLLLQPLVENAVKARHRQHGGGRDDPAGGVARRKRHAHPRGESIRSGRRHRSPQRPGIADCKTATAGALRRSG
jgi:LytS/YehU family sensor histidine kinase